MRTFLALLLSACVVSAQSGTFLAAATAPATPTCATSATTNTWNLWLEGFQGGYETSTPTLIGTAANIVSNFNSSGYTAGKPAGACDAALWVEVPGDGTETYARWDLGNVVLTNTPTEWRLAFNVLSPIPTNTAVLASWNIFSAASTGVALQLYNALGTPQVRMSGTTASAFTSIVTNQWYVVDVYLDLDRATNGSIFTLYSNNTEVASATFQRSDTYRHRYLELGGVSGWDAGEAATVLYDLVSIRTNAPTR